jgi:hypothetical protein
MLLLAGLPAPENPAGYGRTSPPYATRISGKLTTGPLGHSSPTECTVFLSGRVVRMPKQNAAGWRVIRKGTINSSLTSQGVNRCWAGAVTGGRCRPGRHVSRPAGSHDGGASPSSVALGTNCAARRWCGTAGTGPSDRWRARGENGLVKPGCCLCHDEASGREARRPGPTRIGVHGDDGRHIVRESDRPAIPFVLPKTSKEIQVASQSGLDSDSPRTVERSASR